MRGRDCIALLISATIVAGCSMVGPPFETGLPPGTEVDPGQQAVAVCYSGRTTSREELMTTVADLCTEPGASLQLRSEDVQLNDCPLFQKRRAVFVCTAPR